MEISGFVALFAAIILSRIIGERGYRRLSDDEKLRLMDGFSKARAYALIPLLILIGVYWLLLTKTGIDRNLLTIFYFALLIGWVLLRTVLNQRKLAALDLPPAYRRTFTVAQVISLLGLAWFFYAIFGEMEGARSDSESEPWPLEGVVGVDCQSCRQDHASEIVCRQSVSSGIKRFRRSLPRFRTPPG